MSDDQIKEWTGFDIDDLDAELLSLLRALRFGDVLYGYDTNGTLALYGISWLDSSGHLVFGANASLPDLISSGMEGWLLTRQIGDNTHLAYLTGGYGYPADVASGEPMFPLDEGSDVKAGIKTALWNLFRDTLVGATIGAAVESLCPKCSRGAVTVLGAAGGMLWGIGTIAYDQIVADRILTYYYADSAGQVWQQVIRMQDGLIVSYEVNSYSNPWYVSSIEGQ